MGDSRRARPKPCRRFSAGRSFGHPFSGAETTKSPSLPFTRMSEDLKRSEMSSSLKIFTEAINVLLRRSRSSRVWMMFGGREFTPDFEEPGGRSPFPAPKEKALALGRRCGVSGGLVSSCAGFCKRGDGIYTA